MPFQAPTDDELFEFIGHIYASALDPDRMAYVIRTLDDWSNGSLAGLPTSADAEAVAMRVRTIDTSTFEPANAQLMARVVPHVFRAAQIQHRLNQHASKHGAAFDLLHALPMPCVFSDTEGRCIDRNEAFDGILELLSLRLIVGRLRFADFETQSNWEVALSQTSLTATQQSLKVFGADGKLWRIHLVPLRGLAPASGGSRMVMVVFDDRPLEAEFPEGVIGTARLTRAELEVLAALLHGLPAKAIASQRGASVNTVRAQITAILEKTGHGSQKELMASFTSSSFGNSSFGSSNFGPSSTGDAKPGPFSLFRSSRGTATDKPRKH